MHLITTALLFSLWNVCYSNRKPLHRLTVYSGVPDTKNEFPFVVIVQMKKFPYYRLCTGSLLTSSWVLAAANCVSDDYPKIIRYAEFTKNPNDTKSYAQIIKTFIHPSYNEELLKNDFALLHTEKVPNQVFGKLSAVDFKSLIGLPVKYAGFGITGWEFLGTMKDYKTSPEMNVTTPLQVGVGLVVPCEKMNYGMLCIAPRCSAVYQEIRPGDNGAPLLLRGRIVAISTQESPDEVIVMNFSPVSPHLAWIHDIIVSVPD